LPTASASAAFRRRGRDGEDFGVFDAETFVDAVIAPPRSGGETA